MQKGLALDRERVATNHGGPSPPEVQGEGGWRDQPTGSSRTSHPWWYEGDGGGYLENCAPCEKATTPATRDAQLRRWALLGKTPRPLLAPVVGGYTGRSEDHVKYPLSSLVLRQGGHSVQKGLAQKRKG